MSSIDHDLSHNWSASSHKGVDYAIKLPSDVQKTWSYIILLLPFLAIFIGGLVWPIDETTQTENVLRPPAWFMYTAWAVITLAYGVVWNQLYIAHSDRWLLHFMFSLPIILSVIWLILYNGAGLMVEASWVLYALQAALIVITAAVAGLSDIPEWTVFLLPFLGWVMLGTDLNVQDVLAD